MTPSQIALWLLVLLPAVVGGALTLARAWNAPPRPCRWHGRRHRRALAWPSPWRGRGCRCPFMAGSDLALGVDPLSAMVVPTVAVVTLLVLVFSAGEIARPQARFHGLMLLFASAALAHRHGRDPADAAARVGGDGRDVVRPDRVLVARRRTASRLV